MPRGIAKYFTTFDNCFFVLVRPWNACYLLLTCVQNSSQTAQESSQSSLSFQKAVRLRYPRTCAVHALSSMHETFLPRFMHASRNTDAAEICTSHWRWMIWMFVMAVMHLRLQRLKFSHKTSKYVTPHTVKMILNVSVCGAILGQTGNRQLV